MARIARRIAGIGASDLPNAVAFDAYVGPAREITVDPQRGIIALHNGVTPGGKQFDGLLNGHSENYFATAEQGAKADTAFQPADRDPNNIGGDVYSAGNHTETADKKVMTAAERVAIREGAATRTVLKALDTSVFKQMNLLEAGREGHFSWRAGDYAAQVASDPLEGIYIAAASNPSGSTGCWVRQGDWAVSGADARWWGLAADYNPTTKIGTPAQSAINAAFAVVNWVRIPEGRILLTNAVNIAGGRKLSGTGPMRTFLCVNNTMNMTAAGVLSVTHTGGVGNAALAEFQIIFQDQPDSVNIADYLQYPVAISAPNCPGFDLRNVVVQNAWQALNLTGNCGNSIIDSFRFSSYDVGIDIDGSVDSVHINNLRSWVFGMTPNQMTTRRFNATGIKCGRCDDFKLVNSIIFALDKALHFKTGVNGGAAFGQIAAFDADDSGILFEAGQIQWVGGMLSRGPDGQAPMLTQTGGELSMDAVIFQLSGLHASVANGIEFSSSAKLTIGNGCRFRNGAAVVDKPFLRANGLVASSMLNIHGSQVQTVQNVAYTTPAIKIEGGTKLNVSGLTTVVMGSGSRELLNISNTTSGTVIGNSAQSGWSIAGPLSGSLAGLIITNNYGTGGEREQFAGYVPADGVTGLGVPVGWSVNKSATGVYVITHALGVDVANRLAVSVSVEGDGTAEKTAQVAYTTTNSFTVRTRSAGALADVPFSFTARRRR